MFALIANKLFYNLRCRIESETVLKRTLKVLNETVNGGIVICLPGCFSEIISSGQQMMECDVVKEVLKDHLNPSISFLYVPKYDVAVQCEESFSMNLLLYHFLGTDTRSFIRLIMLR